jgi:CheY-like chemotaxis protein
VNAERNVLIIEDDAPMAFVIASTMRLCCDRVDISGTLANAFERLKIRNYTLALLDLSLPDSGPTRSFCAVKDLLLAGAKRVVIITGADLTPELHQNARVAGAEAILSKGDAATFFRKLEGLFNGR